MKLNGLITDFILTAVVIVAVVSASTPAGAGEWDASSTPVRGLWGDLYYGQDSGVFLPGDFGVATGYQMATGLSRLTWNEDGTQKTMPVVKSAHALVLAARVGLLPRTDLALHFPIIVNRHVGSGLPAGERAIASNGIGDFQAALKVSLLDRNRSPVGLAISGFMTVPTGDYKALAGQGEFTGGGEAILDVQIRSLLLAANLGVHYRPELTWLGTTVGSGLKSTFAAQYGLLNEHLFLTAGVTADIDLHGRKNASPAELFAGATGRFGGLSVAMGGSYGLNEHVGNAVGRFSVLAGYHIKWIRDVDNDGVSDARDRCPKAREDEDGFEDHDGCPDLDNDEDGLEDLQDRCPNQAEDRDGYMDGDGCLDLDNDDDEIPDSYDDCPDDPEDRDGKDDDDGCPDRDNDGDGIPDLSDHCPNEQEDRNGFQDEDGCPDQRPRHFFKKNRPIVMGAVGFADDSEELTKEATEVLAEVARSLQLQPNVRIRVEVHTNPESPDIDALILSQHQALAILNFLIGKGVDKVRISSAGYGHSQWTDGWSQVHVELLVVSISEGNR
jgi:outer membrane protein OmpA-like peptidoglycan-associated protein